MKGLRSWAGTLELELTGADMPRTLELLTRENVPVYSVIPVSDVVLRVTVMRRDMKNVYALCEKKGNSIRLLGKHGMFWTLRGLAKRPVLMAVAALLAVLTLFLPTRVLFIQVEGNEQLPTRLVLEHAEACGIRFWASRRAVRSEQMKNLLLEQMPALQWAGINTKGCVAVITVKERFSEPEEEKCPQVASIVASRDGIVLSCTATAGELLCRQGDAVISGQVLISAYSDQGSYIHATLAQGEVYAQTTRQLQVKTPSEWQARQKAGEERTDYSLILGKKRINLWKDSGICGSSCGRMYMEYYLTLPGGFRLPIAIAVDRHMCYESHTIRLPQEDCEARLLAFSKQYLRQQMIAGEILRQTHRVSVTDGAYLLDSSCVCAEMIGRVKQEQIGVQYGEDS